MIKGKVFDIECFKRIFYAAFYDILTGEWHEFEISQWKNDLFRLIKFLEKMREEEYYLIGYNNVGYDGQVLQFIIENYEEWVELIGAEICLIIQKFSSRTIEKSNNGVRPAYKESLLYNRHLDLLKIHHFDNDSRRCSLKWLQYMMNWWNVEESPVHFMKDSLTREEAEDVITYCKNDILSTHQFWFFTIGDTPHKFYAGKNKVQDRLTIIEEGLLPKEAINYSDSKIGDELNKQSYLRLTGKTMNDLYNLRRNRQPTKKFTFGQAIPSYVKFETPEMNNFLKMISKINVSLQDLTGGDKDKQKYPLLFRGTNYVIARGGIHSNEAHRIIIPKLGEILRDADVGSQYPNAIKKRRLFPVHLGIEWNEVGAENIGHKDHYKQAAKKELDKALKAKYKGLEGMYKLALNSGYFGKTIDKTNWQYGPEVGLYCTIGNQFEILMLIEMMELAGIHCVSANTDGIVCLFTEDKEPIYYQICEEWEKRVGNHEMGKLEYTDFEGMYQESINHYIAVKKDGDIKIKGRFSTEDEIHKNNSDKISRVERKALVAHFAEGIPFEKTIRECTNPYDFLIGKKASYDYRWETINKESQVTEYKRLIRFYISLDGEKLVKHKNEDSQATGAEYTTYFDGRPVTIMNKMDKDNPTIEGWNIDYQYYIDNIAIVINRIESLRKNKKYKEPPKEQTSLF